MSPYFFQKNTDPLIALWFATAAVFYFGLELIGLDTSVFGYVSIIAMAIFSLKGLWIRQAQDEIAHASLDWIPEKQLHKIALRHPADLFMGLGFEWSPDIADIARRVPSSALATLCKASNWIQFLGKPVPTFLEKEDLTTHILLLGTTGSGKTRFLELILRQLALEIDRAFVILDPKGDKELVKLLRTLEPQRFILFDRKGSTNIDLDLFGDTLDPATIADRLVDNASSTNDTAKAFAGFSWAAIYAAGSYLKILHQRATISSLARVLQARDHTDMLCTALTNILSDVLGESAFEYEFRDVAAKSVKQKLPRLIDCFNTQDALGLCHKYEGVRAFIHEFTMDPEHFQKLTASLGVELTKLTSGTLGNRLSMESANARIVSLDEVIFKKKILYVNTCSLDDPSVAHKLASLILSSMASIASASARNEKPPKVSVVIDEAAEAMCPAMIQLLNKGRSAGFGLIVATQTIDDFTAVTGSEAQTRQILGNVNTTIALRILDSSSQQYFCDGLPKVQMHALEKSMSTSSAVSKDLNKNAFAISQKTTLESPLDPGILSSLPKLEGFARQGGRLSKFKIPLIKK